MGYAILYCTTCSTQLREPDFDRGAAFRFDGRVYCSKCAPADARAQAATKVEMAAAGTGKVPKVASPSSSAKIKLPDQPAESSAKWPVIAGGGLLAIALLVALAFSGKDSPRPVHPPPSPPPPVVQQKQEATSPPPRERPLLTPAANDKEAEEAVRQAREYAKTNPDDLPGQLALYDTAVRASSLTGHAVAVARERDAVQARVKAMAKTRLDALDVSVKAAADREEFGPAFKLIEEARAQGLGTDWMTEVDQRSQTLQDSANKLFAAVRSEAVEAQKRASDQDVKRLTERVDKWGMPGYKSDLAKAVAAASKKPATPIQPKALEGYRKIWTEAMGAGSFRDFAGALKKIEDASAATHDPAVKAESTSDLELLKQAIASEEEALQLLAKIPKGQKTTLTFMTEAGKVEMNGTVGRNENFEIELAGEKSTVRIPLGEICARSLGQIVKEKRTDRGGAVLCVIDGDVAGGKLLVEGGPAIPDKYWSFKGPNNTAAQAAARKLFYSAERDLRSHARVSDALQKYAGLLKDHATTEFVRRNRPLIASRAEAVPREFYFTVEDLRVGGAFRPARGEKDETSWRAQADAKAAENFVELWFHALAETEYRCWIYVGGCCAEVASGTVQAFDGEDPVGEPAALKPPSMQYKTHEAHAGRGRPVTKWGWAQVPLPKFARAGLKKARIIVPLKGFHASDALVTAVRPGLPTAADLKELERVRMEARGRSDPSLVAHWKMSDGSGPAAVDSGPFGVDARLEKGAAWAPATATPWSPPSIRLDGTGYLNLGNNVTLLQSAPGWTISAWICPEKLAGANDQNVVLGLARNNGGTPTSESRASLSLSTGGCLYGGGRVVDAGTPQGTRTPEKVAKVNVWIHVAVATDYASNSMALYVNGVPQNTTGTINFGGKKACPATPSETGIIGTEEDIGSHFFFGRIADLRLYNRALGREEMVDLAVPPR